MGNDQCDKRNDCSLTRIYVVLLIAFQLILLASCAQTVHVHPGNLTEGQVQEVRAALSGLGFRSIIRSNKHPSPNLGNLLIYFPSKDSAEKLNSLKSVLLSQGIKIDNIVAKKVYKHEYTKRNYGLYFADPAAQIKRVRISDIEFDVKLTDYEFEGVGCGSILQLSDDKTLFFAYLSAGEEITSGLSWGRLQKNDRDVLVIDNGGEVYEYGIKSFVESDSMSKTYSVRLSPLEFYRLPFGCEYLGVYTFSQ